MSRRHAKIETILQYEGILLTTSDLGCLAAREDLNDNIINFWLKYMCRTLLSDEQKKRVIISDSHFFEALETMDVGRTHRWLRKMKLFDHDFMLIPVVEEQHWFLMTLEYPENAYDQNQQRHQTRVRLFDSMGIDFLHEKKAALLKLLFKFLRNAFMYEKSESINVVHNIKVIHEEVKLQTNLYDCGLHLLLNAENFICRSFNIKVNPADDDEYIILLNRKRSKRGAIRGLIRRLGESQTLTAKHDDDNDDVEVIN